MTCGNEMCKFFHFQTEGGYGMGVGCVGLEMFVRDWDIRIPGYSGIRMSRYPGIRLPGYRDIRVSGYPDIRVSGYPGIRISGDPGIRISGGAYTWL